MEMEKRFAIALAAALLSAGASGLGAAGEMQIEYKPLKVAGLQEFGIIRSGLLVSDFKLLQEEWVDHFGTFITQEALINERLLVEVGLGGIFQFGKPEEVGEVFGGSQYKMFFVGPSIAKGTALFGDPDRPALSVSGGLFPFKYNPDAANLGEYLFRTGPYPTYIFNGGLLTVGDNAAYLQGFQANARIGGLDASVFVTTETAIAPFYDWSLSALVQYRTPGGLLEAGAGVKFNRLLPVDKDRTVRKEVENSYFIKHGKAYAGDKQYYTNPHSFYDFKITTAAGTADSINIPRYTQKRDSLKLILDSMDVWLKASRRIAAPDDKGYAYTQEGVDSLSPSFYTPSGTIFMGRISLDLKTLFTSSRFRKEDMRLYAEAALLGWKNYPVYYENRLDRVPVMLGMNIPTFGILDLLAVQVERFHSPFENSTLSLGDKNHATPYLPQGVEEIPYFSKSDYNDITTRDDWAWTVLMRRNVLSTLSVSAQFAKDHMRTVGTDWSYQAKLEPNTDLHSLSDWYWMVQVAWGI